MENCFYPGQKVVCVNTSCMFGSRMVPPVAGETYEVKAILSIERRVNLIISGATNIHMGKEVGFRSTRFRPLDTLTEQVERIEKEGCPAEAPVEPEPQTA